MGTRQGRQRTEEFWIPTSELATPAGHPFYECLNRLLEEHDFDSFVEDKCRGFYATKRGRPGLVPGIYFRLLLVGYFVLAPVRECTRSAGLAIHQRPV